MSGPSQMPRAVEPRLHSLGLPESIVQMIHRPQSPSPADSQILGETLQRYSKSLGVIRSALDLEEQKPSHMVQGLRHVEAIAQYRVMACMSISAAWRRLPMELWDKVFVFYLDYLRIQARQNGTARRRAPPDPYLRYYASLIDRTYPVVKDEPRYGDGVQLDWAVMDAPHSLSRVCQAWRVAVLSSPSIWANVSISTVAQETAIGKMPFVASSDSNRIVSRLRRIEAKPTPWSLTIIEKPPPKAPESGSNSYDGLPLSSVLVQAQTPFNSVERLKVIVYPTNSPYLEQVDFSSITSMVIVRRGDPSQENTARSPLVPSLKEAVLVNVIGLSV